MSLPLKPPFAKSFLMNQESLEANKTQEKTQESQ
jgi:hypothetical protein